MAEKPHDPPEIFLSVARNRDSEFGCFWSENGDGPDCACGKGCQPTRYVLATPPIKEKDRG
jgi:hypothetical protein